MDMDMDMDMELPRIQDHGEERRVEVRVLDFGIGGLTTGRTQFQLPTTGL
jgi:hypothetical protein